MLKELSKEMALAVEDVTEERFFELIQQIDKAFVQARESLQAISKDKIQIIIDKLHRGENLTRDDISIVRGWIISDALGYAKMENNFNDWLMEFKRLTGVLQKYGDASLKQMDLSELQSLMGVLQDAKFVAEDISRYLQVLYRIDKFEEVINRQLSEDERDVLIGMLSASLNYDDV